MGITVHREFFADRSQALDDINKNGLWPTTLVAGPSPGLEVHWHSEDVYAYVLEGETSFLDGESGVRHPVKAGDKVVIPTGSLHAECEIRGKVIYYIGLSRAVEREEFLRLRPPSELES